jgi:hypothetical protein
MTKTSLSSATWASPVAQRAYSAPQRCLGADSILAREARRFQWHRHSCLPRGTKGLCAVAKPLPQQRAKATLSLPSKFLIANPRLTLRVSPIRICKLKISNRKFSTISCPEARRVHLSRPFTRFKLLITRHSHTPGGLSADEGSPATALLIVTPRLELTISPILSIPSNFLIVTKRTFLHPGFIRRSPPFARSPQQKAEYNAGAKESPHETWRDR